MIEETLLDLIGSGDLEEENLEAEDGDEDPESPVARWSIRFVDSMQYLSASLERLVAGLDPATGFSIPGLTFHQRPWTCSSGRASTPTPTLTPSSASQRLSYHPGLPSTTTSVVLSALKRTMPMLRGCSPERGAALSGTTMTCNLKTDILLMTDVLEFFRSESMRDYGLDPCTTSLSPHTPGTLC